ncbi:hypothetical protein QNI19_08585 [Cytophagaceae bacterium DM2B3-1]|uniref:Outer membrane protein beta-barrel domain-containing protein n=1 Tax=Xanthocytophaga flava TaxID=3048013 RepID=A0ABT7CGX5_9BACT|nr:hypothetical protein [Xanthocytophaga flavus]MDJ1471031.1 hypothetical protein [Xanthocytophaga flavus]MDJ1492986.1 hypothetical protein [Xanthocytophaga flavus]
MLYKINYLYYFLIFSSCLLSANGYSQVYQMPESVKSHWAGIQVGAAPALKTGFTGGWQLPAIGKHTPLLTASVATPVFLLKKPDTFEGKVGLADYLSFYQQWGVTIGISATVATTKNTNGRITTAGTALTLIPGYRTHHWYAGAWINWQYNYAAHLRHSDYVQDSFDDRYESGETESAPYQGWVSMNTSILQLGAAAGYSVKAYSIHLNAGYQTVPGPLHINSLPDVGILPFGGSVSLLYHW